MLCNVIFWSQQERIHVNWLALECNSPRFSWNYNYCQQKRFSDKLIFATDPNIPTFTVSFSVCVIFRLGLGFRVRSVSLSSRVRRTLWPFFQYFWPSLLKIFFQSRLREESRRLGSQGVWGYVPLEIFLICIFKDAIWWILSGLNGEKSNKFL